MPLRGAVEKARAPRALSAHQQRLREQLDSAEFRMLNESLYTTTGAEALALMSGDARLFATYHAGFARQAARWPHNPLDAVLRVLRSTSRSAVVADFGCGEARLAAEAPQKVVHSFDLVAANARVTPCDIASVPLEKDTVDVAVFCLALMGTDYHKFLEEAHRVLVPRGTLLIAEVASRFDAHDPAPFVRGVEALGFRALPAHPLVTSAAKKGKRQQPAKSKRGGRRRKTGKAAEDAQGAKNEQSGKRSSSEFFFYFAFECLKEGAPERSESKPKAPLPPLKPCIYKRR